VIPVTVLFGIPAIITLAILKYGLYQIDVIINRAVQYGLLSAALTGVYAGIVVGIGTLAGYAGGPVLTVAAAVTIAVLFQPVRQRARLVANRLVYGERATPYQVLADFARTWPGSWTSTRHSTGWRRSWPGRPARSGWRSGSGSGAAAPAGDLAAWIRSRPRPSRWPVTPSFRCSSWPPGP
jgi:hypothetical protein